MPRETHLEPGTEIELTLAIGGVRAAATFTVKEPLTLNKLKDLAARRSPALADDVFDAFVGAFSEGFVSKTLDRENGEG